MTDIAEIAARHKPAQFDRLNDSGHYTTLLCEYCDRPWPCDTASVLEQLKRLSPNALGTNGRYPFNYDPILGMYCTFCEGEDEMYPILHADEMRSMHHVSKCKWARFWKTVIEK